MGMKHLYLRLNAMKMLVSVRGVRSVVCVPGREKVIPAYIS